MDSSSSSIWFQLKKFRYFCFFFFIAFTSTVSSSLATPAISYSDHCASLVPEATPAGRIFARYPFLEPVTSHYTGGQNILGGNSSWSISFSATHNLFRTNTDGIYKIQARLRFSSSNIYYRPSNLSYHGWSNYSRIAHRTRPLVFFLDGFWSESSKKLCMVGTATWYSKEGNPLNLEAVLKLNFGMNLNLTTSLVSGVLESLASPDDSNYFESISILGFPRVAEFKYNYTLVSDEGCEGGVDNPRNTSLSMESVSPCSVFTRQFKTYQLKYSRNCSSSRSCTPFGQRIGYLPSFMSLYTIQCSWFNKRLRFLVEFQDRRYTRYDQSFNPNKTLIGEGTWNGTKKLLCVVACQSLNQKDALGNAQVGDCSIRMTLWFPAVRSIKQANSIEGRIWTTKKADDIGYFEPIKFQGIPDSLENYGSKYEFTEMEKVQQSCPAEKAAKRKRGRYPVGDSHDMRFDMSVKYKNMEWTGFAVPVFVGNRWYSPSTFIGSNSPELLVAMAPAAISSTTSYNGPLNISYEIGFNQDLSFISAGGISSLKSTAENGRVDIYAEGVYDGKTGRLCMVGCRNVQSFGRSLKNDSMDCEILVKFQFPRIDVETGGIIKGTIESLRDKGDVLYFERLDILSLSYTESAAIESIWRMDLEIIMVLISKTISCVFIGLQLFHVRKRPEIVPFISVVMMLLLTLGHMVPLMLNFEALFLNSQNRQNIWLGGAWLEVNEVVVRITTMVAFLLQFRLLQLAWTVKLGNGSGNQKNTWILEMKTLFICLLIYIVGGSFALLMSWWNDDYNGVSRYSLWADLRSYAGLTLDGFLFPQIILNMLQVSKGVALSHSFYIGITFVRLLPHAYDLYRGPNNISQQFDRIYIYANPRADFYSASWDVIIAGGCIVFAIIIFLQQHFGGRFIFPKRFRECAEYEKVPVANTESVDHSAM